MEQQRQTQTLTQEDWEPIVQAFNTSGSQRSQSLKQAVHRLVSEGKGPSLTNAFREIETYVKESQPS